MKIKNIIMLSSIVMAINGCNRLDDVGRPPAFSPVTHSQEYLAMVNNPSREVALPRGSTRAASLWRSGPTSLLGDRRASTLGDLMTVVIEINDKAEISNSSSRSRSGSESLSIPQLLGIPNALVRILPEGASNTQLADIQSSGSSGGDGTVRRKEKLTLRVAATVTRVLPNGHLQIQGSQEVRVNFELRELLVTGFVRPEDVSRLNEITYDKIASARISYGGRGQISDVQQPRYGQQVLDIVLPF